MEELRVPEPTFHVKQEQSSDLTSHLPSPAKLETRKPQVKRRTEEDEVNLELPPGSGKRSKA